MAKQGNGKRSVADETSAHRDQEQGRTPLYEAVYGVIRAQIESGEIAPGALLPSIRDMAVQFTISTTTAKRVLAELVNSGHAEARGTRGHMATLPTEESPSRESAKPASATTPIPTPAIRTTQAITTKSGVEAPSDSIDERSEPASPDAALALGVKGLSSPVIVRRRVSTDEGGMPVQFQVSYVSPRIAPKNRALAPLGKLEASWHDALAAHLAKALPVSESYISARHPSDTEAAMLALAPSACVLVRVDLTNDQSGEPVEYSVTVWPGDTTRMANND